MVSEYKFCLSACALILSMERGTYSQYSGDIDSNDNDNLNAESPLYSPSFAQTIFFI